MSVSHHPAVTLNQGKAHSSSLRERKRLRTGIKAPDCSAKSPKVQSKKTREYSWNHKVLSNSHSDLESLSLAR